MGHAACRRRLPAVPPRHARGRGERRADLPGPSGGECCRGQNDHDGVDLTVRWPLGESGHVPEEFLGRAGVSDRGLHRLRETEFAGDRQEESVWIENVDLCSTAAGNPTAAGGHDDHSRAGAGPRADAAPHIGTPHPGPGEVPRRLDRLRRLLTGRDRDGLRLPQGGAGRAGGGRTGEIPPARRIGHALQLEPRLDEAEMEELVIDAWRMVVPKKVAAARLGAA